MAKVTIILTPAVGLVNRRAGYFGIAEQIALTCGVSPAAETIATLGGVSYKIVVGSGRLAAANPALGTATYTCGVVAETVAIAAYGGNAPTKELGRASFKVIAPTGLSFARIGNHVIHTNGSADAGFRGQVSLTPVGVSYEALVVREGEFRGKASGYYSALDGIVHPASVAPINIVNGNQMNGNDRIYSGIQGAPWSKGRFDWHIPWQYRVVGTADWETFAYANHVQEINALGAVSIGKFNAGPFTAKVTDPTVP